MNFCEDTIAAISTPIGQGGIGIVRLSGPESVPIAKRVFKSVRKADITEAKAPSIMYGRVVDPESGEEVDEALVSVMRAPNSYTREDVVEINCHGGMMAVRKILGLVLKHGARLAEPGEFTKRAFLNGRISLMQAEAVKDLIAARTEQSMKIAVDQLRGGLSEKLGALRNSLIEICAYAEAYIDFPEEDIETGASEEIMRRLGKIREESERLSRTFEEARFFREGLSVAIVGRPNVGKSSLLNALLMRERAIVTPIPGTTRDTIEEYLNIQGLPVRIVDTAGIRSPSEAVEKEGIRRSIEALEQADFVIAVLDGSEPLRDTDIDILEKIKEKNAVVAINKCDLSGMIHLEDVMPPGKKHISISARNGEGLEELKSFIFQSTLKDWKEDHEGIIVTNIRHKLALDRASASLADAIGSLISNQPLEIFALELRDALDSIGEITGAVTTEDILNRIFSDFCIGK
jgi:tRNA modification GTPase